MEVQVFFNNYAEYEGKDGLIKTTTEERQRLAREVHFSHSQITNSPSITSVLSAERLLT